MRGFESGSVDEQATCPACRARQPYAASCRRCKCDLSPLYERWRRSLAHRRRCLDALRHDGFEEALLEAENAFRLGPGAAAARLMAVCQWLTGDFSAAIATQRWANATATAVNGDSR